MSALFRQKSSSAVSFVLGIPLPEMDEPPSSSDKRRRATDSLFPTTISSTYDPVPTICHKSKIRHINGDTLCRLAAGEYSEFFDAIVIIDARFPYEYDGGHVRNAINVTDPGALKSQFFTNVTSRVAFVFHCEFSQVRGPSLAGFFREIDRDLNVYPKLSYPFVYILDGGYSDFYHKFPESCDGGYVRMFDQKARENGELVTANGSFKDRMVAAKTQLRKKQGSENVLQGNVDPVSPKIPRRRLTSCADD